MKNIFGQIGLYIGILIVFTKGILSSLDFVKSIAPSRTCEGLCFFQDILERTLGGVFIIILPLVLLGVLVDWYLEKKHNKLYQNGGLSITQYALKGLRYGVIPGIFFALSFIYIAIFTKQPDGGEAYAYIFAVFSIPLWMLVGGLLGATYRRHSKLAISVLFIFIVISFLSIN